MGKQLFQSVQIGYGFTLVDSVSFPEHRQISRVLVINDKPYHYYLMLQYNIIEMISYIGEHCESITEPLQSSTYCR